MNLLSDTTHTRRVFTGECGISVEVERLASKVSMSISPEGLIEHVTVTNVF